MQTTTILFWFILDPITFGLGSIGAYILIQELTGLDNFPTAAESLAIIKNHWKACLALGIAVAYFFYRLFTVMGQ